MKAVEWAKYALGFGALLIAPGLASANTIVVTTSVENASDSQCSLLEAVEAANSDTALDGCAAGGGADVIEIPAGSYQSGFTITDDLELVGAGMQETIIDALLGNRRGFSVVGGVAVAARDFTVRGSRLSGEEGAGIHSDGPLVLTRVRVTDNRLAGRTDGSNNGLLVRGGGIYVTSPGSLEMYDSQVDSNAANGANGNAFGGSSQGAGIYVGGAASARIERSVLNGNSGNGGSGLSFWGGASGGGFYSDSTAVTITNTVVTNNSINAFSGAARGSGLYLADGAAVSFSTIYGNLFGSNGDGRGGGIASASFADDTGPIVKSCIVAQNGPFAATGGRDIGGNVQSAGFTIIGSTAGGSGESANWDIVGAGNTDAGNIVDPTFTLGAFGENGAFLPDFPLSADSVAVDATNCDTILDGTNASDLRGALRPGGGACDIGAQEFVVAENLLDVLAEAAGANCAAGGVAIVQCTDTNADGVCNAWEQSSTMYVCNGTNGTDGSNGTDGTDGTNGTDGTDGTNGTDGDDGTDGTDGYSTLVVLTDVDDTAGECSGSGVRVDVGLDNGDGDETANDGVLGAGEIDQTRYVCDGVDGEDGTDGANGTDGSDGADGIDGSDGMDGMAGEGGCSAAGGGGGWLAALMSMALIALLRRRRQVSVVHRR